MGYPMTFQRVLKRNGLTDGDYTKAPDRWQRRVNTEHAGFATQEEFDRAMISFYRDRLREYERDARQLAGDLRRLEDDAVDERATCAAITRVTGIDADTVAAVLRAFIEW